jgi:hypothetical protein
VSLSIPYKDCQIVVIAESVFIPAYDPNSADNTGSPGEECRLDSGPFSSRHRVVIKNGADILVTKVFLAGGGASGVHAHSAFVRENICFLAVGHFVCALQLPTLQLIWATLSDSATCFGVYDAPAFGSIISHGELEIARLTYAGKLVWSAAGRDIFTGPFVLHADHVEATDWDGSHYQIDLETGCSRIV